jgi:hypothetical protein
MFAPRNNIDDSALLVWFWVWGDSAAVPAVEEPAPAPEPAPEPEPAAEPAPGMFHCCPITCCTSSSQGCMHID